MTGNVNPPDAPLDQHLKYLKLPFMREQHRPLAKQAAKKSWSHEDYLENWLMVRRRYERIVQLSAAFAWHAFRS